MKLKWIKKLHKDERGAVYTEFLIAFPIMLMMFLAIVQLALIYSARLGVRSAATRAVRSAVVVIPDDPGRYGGEDAYEVNQVGGGSGGLGSGLASLLRGRGSERMRTIRGAAAFPLAGFAPRAGSVLASQSLADSYIRNAGDLAYAIPYQVGATAVTFPTSPGGMTFTESFGGGGWFGGGNPRDMITARVTYFYQCSVPIVTQEPWEICAGALDLIMAAPDVIVEGAVGTVVDGLDGLRELGFDTYRDWLRGREDLANGMEELQFSGNPLSVVPAAIGNRFVILRAEASMPMQGAQYTW